MEHFSLQKSFILTVSYAKQTQSYLWTRIAFPESANIVKHLGLMNLSTGIFRLRFS